MTARVVAMPQPDFGAPQGGQPFPGLDIARLTDAHAAELLARRSGSVLRFDQNQQAWFCWTGSVWQTDHAGARHQAVVALAHDLAAHAISFSDLETRKRLLTFALKLESRHGIENVLSLAQHVAPVCCTTDLWDRDPWVLATPGATVDLRSGEVYAPRPSDMCQRGTAVGFDSHAIAPRWMQFLNEVFGGDDALVGYVRRWLGYCCTGSVREQAFTLLSGSGANGKSVLQATVAHVLGSYGYVAPFSTFLKGDRRDGGNVPSPELAALVGRRMVCAAETCEGSRLDEGRLKSLTGGEDQTARHLFGRHFSYTPTAKIVLSANHRPRVSDESLAFWRRCHVIPFGETFTGPRADPNLLDALRDEAQGVLAWMVGGALEWGRDGLQPPPAVLIAAERYRGENDPLADFRADCLEDAGFDDHVFVRDIRRAYDAWCDREGIDARDRLRSRALRDRLVERYPAFHHHAGSALRHVRLRDPGVTL